MEMEEYIDKMKIDGIEIEFNEVEFKIVCIKNCEEEYLKINPSFDPSNLRRIKSGEIFTTNNLNFFWVTIPVKLSRLFSSDGDCLGIFDNSNFMKIEEYRNIKIEKLLN